MKYMKLHSILLFYFMIFVFLYFYSNEISIKIMSDHIYIIIGFLFIQIIFIFQTCFTWFRRNIIPYSLLIQQAVFIIFGYYILEFSSVYQFILIVVTGMSFYLILFFHKKVLVYYKHRANYRLKITSHMVNLVYVLYGLICYSLFYFSNKNIEIYFEEIEGALYVALMPYIIIALFLYRLHFDSRTDDINTKKHYKKVNRRKIIIRNIIINSLLVLLFIIM